jgi:hypothetical protein
MPDKIPFVLKITGTRGAIGKCYVIRYRRSCGYYMSRYPNFKNYVPSQKQKKQRSLFREAVAFGNWIKSNTQRKEAFLNNLPPKKRRWQPFRWMVSHYLKASIAQREMIKAKMQRSKIRLKPSVINSVNNFFHKYQWTSLWQKRNHQNGSSFQTPPRYSMPTGLMPLNMECSKTIEQNEIHRRLIPVFLITNSFIL